MCQSLFFLFLCFVACCCMQLAGAKRHAFNPGEKRVNPEGLKDLVVDLPGQPQVGFQHYAGYVTVDEKHGRELFYWFFKAASGAKGEKPLVLWLNGGPGCSSVGYGATQEIGPFIVNSRGNGLELNPYAWNKEANVLFLESPVGVGFSYSNMTSDYDLLGDDFTANDTYSFLHNWFKKFPEYRNHSFYIAGESYAGKYVPELAELIYEMNKDPSLYIDLKGFLLGNPETSDAEDWQGMVDYAWSHAVVSDETYSIIKETCDFNSSKTWSNEECNKSVQEVLQQYKEIDIYSLYTSLCINNSSNSGVYTTGPVYKKEFTMMPRMMGGNYDPCVDDYAHAFYNRPEVQKALHASDGVNLKGWSICNTSVFHGWKDSKPSVLPIYRKLVGAGLKIWVYSGDTDGRVPVLSTRYSIDSLGLPKIGSWRPWYHQMQVGGWLQEYEGLTFVTFRGAGHAVPMFKPSNSLALFTSFITGQSLPLQRSNS
ncbi:serine carboxypeptidase-like 31 [Nymphaea colorata]|nr:serine carboxypeptidase-like 31 [Nymphaea colorata]